MIIFLQAVAKFMGKARGGRATFEPDRIVMGGGATGANELIMFCLADPGDAFLVPSPYYAAYDHFLFLISFTFSYFSLTYSRSCKFEKVLVLQVILNPIKFRCFSTAVVVERC